MKKIIISTLLFLIFPAICLGAFDISQWKNYKDINLNLANDSLVEVILDDEIFSDAEKNLSDVRIIGENDEEIPFKLVSKESKNERIEYPIKMTNNSYLPGQFSWAVLDFGEKGKLVNSLTIKTSSENFQRNVTVYGSDDANNWNVLRDKAYIYDYSDNKGNFKSQNTSVSFPESTFRYLKLEISDENNNPVKINSVTTHQYIAKEKREEQRHPKFSVNENKEKQSTELLLDLEISGIPTNRLLLKSDDINFNRGVLISSSKDKNSWKTLGRNYIFRYNTPKFSGENLQLNFPEINDRYLKIEILNKDNTALNFEDVVTYSIYREIIFSGKSNQNYRIFYGNEKAVYPQYDLEKYFQYLDVDSAQKTTLSNQKENPKFIPEKEPIKPISERIPYLFSTVLVLVSILLLFLVYRFLKK